LKVFFSVKDPVTFYSPNNITTSASLWILPKIFFIAKTCKKPFHTTNLATTHFVYSHGTTSVAATLSYTINMDLINDVRVPQQHLMITHHSQAMAWHIIMGLCCVTDVSSTKTEPQLTLFAAMAPHLLLPDYLIPSIWIE
jgi:hypothetical protein